MKVATASRPESPTSKRTPSAEMMVKTSPSGRPSSDGIWSTRIDAASTVRNKSASNTEVSIVGEIGTAMVARGGGQVKAILACSPPQAPMDWIDAQAFAFTLIIASGKPHGQVWHELRRAQGFAGRRRVDPPFSVVLDAVAALVLSANQPGPEQAREFGVLVMLYRAPVDAGCGRMGAAA